MKMRARKPEGEKKQTDWGRISQSVERLSGVSLHDVTVHYNSPKPSRLQARAYTQGTNIYLGPGQEQHLEHEAGHAAQQKQGRVKPDTRIDGEPANTNAGLEKEAQTIASKIRGGFPQSFPNVTPSTAAGAPATESNGVVQRMPKHDDNWQKRLADFKAKVPGSLSAADAHTEATMYAAAQAAASTLDTTYVPTPGVGPEIHAIPKPVEDYINWVKSLTGGGAVPESTITWQPTWDGLGTVMEAYLRPNAIPKGSEPTIGWDGVWGDLANRRGNQKNMTMYVMGHMLNDNIGGPGLAYNLTPLIGKNKKGGADDSNALHLNMIERDVKNACDDMNAGTSGIAYVYYYVKADYGRATPRSKQIGILNNVLTEYTRIATTDSTATHNSVKKDMEKAGTIDKNDIKKACNSISTGPATKAKMVIPELTKNIELWKTEDKYVPENLICQWGTHDGTKWIKQVAKNVRVSLPDDISVLFKDK